jgi:ABC-type lipoprotein release transport system permease subunit
MRYFLEIAQTGLVALLLHPLRSLVTTGSVVVVLVPYLVGLGLSKGIQQEAEAAIRFGTDLYVTGTQFGRTVPIPLTAVEAIQKVDGVTEVVPRIVGGLVLGKDRENAVLVGIPLEKLPASITCVAGRLPRASPRNELVVGSDLARRLKLDVGSLIPPFYHNRHGERISQVVGIFRSEVSLWQARLILTSLDTAAAVFDQEGLATDLLVTCRPGCQAQVSATILRNLALSPPEAGGSIRPQVTAREDLQALLPSGLLHREGIFNLHFVLAFAVGMAVVLVTSGLGLSERRREIGILKATGWQTDEILLRSLVESFLLSLAGACLALLGAFLWLRGLNGYWMASIFLAGVDKAPGFAVPCRLTPVPAVLAFLISFVVVMSGSLYAAWRAATVAPSEAMR